MADDYEEVNIWEYIEILIRRKWLILMIVAVSLVGGIVVSSLRQDFYEGTLALYGERRATSYYDFNNNFCFYDFFTNLMPGANVEVSPKTGRMAIIILRDRGPNKKTVEESLDKEKQELIEKTKQVVGDLVELKLMHPVYVVKVKNRKWGVNLGIAGVLGLFVGVLMAFGLESYERWKNERERRLKRC